MVIFQNEKFTIHKTESIMKLKNIFIYTLAGLCGAPMVASAQVTLSDKASQKVELG